MPTPPTVRAYLLDVQTNTPLHWENVDGTVTFKGSSGQEFVIRTEITRTSTEDQRTFLVMGKLDGEYIGYSFQSSLPYKGCRLPEVCIFDGFPINKGCGRAMFKFNDMIVGSSNVNNDLIGKISIEVFEQGARCENPIAYPETKSTPHEGTEKQHAKFFENQRLSTVSGTTVEDKYSPSCQSYFRGELLCTTTICYDDSTHVTLRASEQNKKKRKCSA